MRVATSQSEVEAKKVAEGLIHTGWKKKVRKNAKPSKTTFRILSYEYWKDKATDKIDVTMPVTRIELTPWTGRTHQLRVHCAAVGHPIVGDTAYGLAGDAGPYGGMDHHILGPGEVYRCHAVDEPSKQILHLLKIPSISIQESIRSCVKESGQVMCLHRDLTLRHPKTGEMVSFTAPSKF
jgi:23S rRNA-/tRNA-specific pseudouridylate synthase